MFLVCCHCSNYARTGGRSSRFGSPAPLPHSTMAAGTSDVDVANTGTCSFVSIGWVTISNEHAGRKNKDPLPKRPAVASGGGVGLDGHQ